jgi:hypothetical protein
MIDRSQNGIFSNSKSGHFILTDSRGLKVLSVVDEATNFGSNFTKVVCVTEDQNSLQIYPNPTNDIGIRLTHATHQINAIYIFSQDGKSVFETVSDQQSVFIPVSDLSPGIYLVKVVTDFGFSTSKFIKL